MLGGLLLAGGCGARTPADAPLPTTGFRTAETWILSGSDTVPLRVEIAETPEQWRLGLADRPGLAPAAGMLFRFPGRRPRGTAFWMYRTRVPLSVAFLDSVGTILEIRDMEPCRIFIPFLCRRYAAGVAFEAALEVNRGFFSRRGIGVGDRVVLRSAPARRPVVPRGAPR